MNQFSWLFRVALQMLGYFLVFFTFPRRGEMLFESWFFKMLWSFSYHNQFTLGYSCGFKLSLFYVIEQKVLYILFINSSKIDTNVFSNSVVSLDFYVTSILRTEIGCVCFRIYVVWDWKSFIFPLCQLTAIICIRFEVFVRSDKWFWCEMKKSEYGMIHERMIMLLLSER